MTNLSTLTNFPVNNSRPAANKPDHLISNNHNKNLMQGANKSTFPDTALHKAASEFEAMFIKQMVLSCVHWFARAELLY